MSFYITTFPGGFATTPEAYHAFIRYNEYDHLAGRLQEVISSLDNRHYSNLADVGRKARQLMYCATMPDDVAKAIADAYSALDAPDVTVAVLSSPAEEGPLTAEMAGLHDSYRNISGETCVIDSIQMCFVSLYTDKAIRYREEKGFNHAVMTAQVWLQKVPV